MKVGDPIVLWETEYSKEAYRDQFGKAHAAYVVERETAARIAEVKQSPCVYGKGSTGPAYRAVSESGEEFTCNWNHFPDDSMTPTYYWDAKEGADGKFRSPIDACQAFRFFLHVRPDGSRAIPAGGTVCEKHGRASLDGRCWECDWQSGRRNC